MSSTGDHPREAVAARRPAGAARGRWLARLRRRAEPLRRYVRDLAGTAWPGRPGADAAGTDGIADERIGTSLPGLLRYAAWKLLYRAVSVALPVDSIPLDYRTKSLREDIHIFVLEKGVPGSRDRRLLERRILPAIASMGFSRVLFVGCRRYTSEYPRIFDGRSAEYWTIDRDPKASRWGAPGRHVTGDVRELDSHFPPCTFDVVLLNGVFGYGVDDRDGMERTVEAIHRVLRPGGILMIGYPRHVPDPCGLGKVRELFDRGAGSPLPPRVTLEHYTYDFLTARRGTGGGRGAGRGAAAAGGGAGDR